MPRIGRHPLKVRGLKKGFPTKEVTITTVVYIPMLEGYWRESLDVLRLFFDSLFCNTKMPFDLMVFDNGSCDDVRKYLNQLQNDGKIQYLVLSEYNLCKLGAMNFLFSVAPGKYVSFVDSDAYFRSGWLKSSLEVMETFPQAGQVTALPTSDKTTHYYTSTYQGIKSDPTIDVKTGKLIPEQFLEAHRLSIGKSRELYYRSVGKRNETKISRNNVRAYIAAQDFQFTTRKDIIRQVLPLEVTEDEEYYDPIYSPVFESRLDALGYWRLSTGDYLVHHIGNTLPSSDSEASWVFDDSDIRRKSRKRQYNGTSCINCKLLRNHYVRKLLKKINTLTYSLLYEE